MDSSLKISPVSEKLGFFFLNEQFIWYLQV